MSFIPGAIAGAIELGIDGFTQPLLQAEQLASQFPGLMEESLAKPLADIGQMAEGVGSSMAQSFAEINSFSGEIAGVVEASGTRMLDAGEKAAEGFHRGGDAAREGGHSILRSMVEAQAIMELFPQWVATFWANPLLGMADLARETGEKIVEAFRHVTDDALEMSLAAEKLGVSVEFFSQWAGVAQAVNVEAGQLSNGLYMLNRIVGEELQNPTKELTRAFGLLGISTQWLNSHLGDSQAIFLRVKEGLDGLTDAQSRSFVTQELLGRGARDLIPLFMMKKSQVDELMQSQRQFGDVTEESEGRAARAFKVLQVEAGMAWDGIEKTAMRPVLEFFLQHQQAIKAQTLVWSKDIQAAIGQIFDYVQGPEGRDAFGQLEQTVHQVIADLPSLKDDVNAIAAAMIKAAGVANDFAKTLDTLERHWETISRLSGNTPGSDPKYNFQVGSGDDINKLQTTTGLPNLHVGDRLTLHQDNSWTNDSVASDPTRLSMTDRQSDSKFILDNLHIHVHHDDSDGTILRLMRQATAQAKARRDAMWSELSTGGMSS